MNTIWISTNVQWLGSASYLASYIDKAFLQQLEPTRVFERYSARQVAQNGFSSVTFMKSQKSELTYNQATLVPWITPNAVWQGIDTITVSAKQYGMYSILSDELLSVAEGYPLFDQFWTILWNNMKRIMDIVIQNEVMAWTNVVYASTTSGWTRAANRAALGSTSKMFAYDLAYLHTYLTGKYALEFGGEWFIMVAHPFVTHWIKTEITTGGFIDVTKYQMPEKTIEWLLGRYHGVTIYESSNIQPFASSVSVYPSLVFWREAYAAITLQPYQLIVKWLWEGGTADPLNQRATIGAKVAFACKILQQDCMVRFESASSF